MKVLLVTPWPNAWVPYYQAAFERRGHQFAVVPPQRLHKADVIVHGWASGDSQPLEGCRNIMFCRRYELFSGGFAKVRGWNYVSALICVNTWIARAVEELLRGVGIGTPVRTIYNGTDCGRWTFRERAHGQQIGMACHVHPKKNLPLALQILASLPKGYSLHVAGEVQDSCTAEYLLDLAARLDRGVTLYGHVSDLDQWWEQMNYCLSTSISEGNPNNVIEAMAKGIKPIVHDWPGAGDQFPDDLRFTSAARAVDMIAFEKDYESQRYRDLVQYKFSLANIERVVDIALEGLT